MLRLLCLVTWLAYHSFIHGESINRSLHPIELNNSTSRNTAVCLAENDGNPTRAMEALGERDIGKSMMMSMATAGLVGSGPTTVGLSTGQLITAYAQHELIKAAVNTMLVTTIDGQDFGKTLEANLKTAALSTVAAFGAHKIGDLYKGDVATSIDTGNGASSSSSTTPPISSIMHKALHTGLGAGIGATTAAVTGQDVTRGAVSGGFGALAGTLMTEAMADKETTEQQAQRITQMSDFMTAALAFAVGLDPVFAYTASHNANEHNALKHLDTLKALGIVKEGEGEEEAVVDGKDEDEQATASKQQKRGRQRERDKARSFFTRTPSPPRTDTWGQTHVAAPVKKFVSGMVPNAVKDTVREAGVWVGRQHAIADSDLQQLKDKQTAAYVFKGSALDRATKLARITAFEALDMMGTGYDYAKAYARRCVRALGVPADVAQDIVNGAEIAFIAKGAVTAGKDIVKAAVVPAATDDVLFAVKFKAPDTAANSNFLRGVNRNVMPVPVPLRATGTLGLTAPAPTLDRLAIRYGATDASAAVAPRPVMASHGSGASGSGMTAHTSSGATSSLQGGGQLGAPPAAPKPTSKPMRKAFEAEDVELLKHTQAPYDPRAMEAMLRERYGADAVSSSTLLRAAERNVKLAGQRHPETGVVFDLRGNPIFDDVAVFDTRIGRGLALSAKSKIHKQTATRELATALEGNPTLKAKFTPDQLVAIAEGNARIPGLTWHHHQDIGRMQLIDEILHRNTGHTGENLWKRGLDAAE